VQDVWDSVDAERVLLCKLIALPAFR